jgi:hypothetical protein
LEFGLARIDRSTLDHVNFFLVWSFDPTGATLWQGAPKPRIVLTVPRDNILGVGLQEGAEVVNSVVYDRLALVTRKADGPEIVVPFMVRPAKSPLVFAKMSALRSTRAQIVTALGDQPELAGSR